MLISIVSSSSDIISPSMFIGFPVNPDRFFFGVYSLGGGQMVGAFSPEDITYNRWMYIVVNLQVRLR